jgi:hypothetical protein
MVSEDSTSRVMVLPVTIDDVSKRLMMKWRPAYAARESGQLTGLYEDLHRDGVR